MISIETTAEEVRAIRERTGEGMMTIKRRLLRDRAYAAVEEFRRTGDRDLLADILTYLINS